MIKGLVELNEKVLFQNQLDGIRFEYIVASILDDAFPQAIINLTRYTDHSDLIMNLNNNIYIFECKRSHFYRKKDNHLQSILIRFSQFEALKKYSNNLDSENKIFYVIGCVLPNKNLIITILNYEKMEQILVLKKNTTKNNNKGACFPTHYFLQFPIIQKWIADLQNNGVMKNE